VPGLRQPDGAPQAIRPRRGPRRWRQDSQLAATIFERWLALLESLYWPTLAPFAVRPMPSKYSPVVVLTMRTVVVPHGR
jgi:hypothetical protein